MIKKILISPSLFLFYIFFAWLWFSAYNTFGLHMISDVINIITNNHSTKIYHFLPLVLALFASAIAFVTACLYAVYRYKFPKKTHAQNENYPNTKTGIIQRTIGDKQETLIMTKITEKL